MNIWSAVSLFAFMTYLYIGFYTYKSFKNTAVTKLFLWLCISSSVWSFGYAFVYVSADYAWLWMKVSALGWCTFSSLALHTAIRFTERKLPRYPWLLGSLYLPSAVFLFMSIFLFWPDNSPSQLVQDFFYTGDFLYDFSFLSVSILLLAAMMRRTKIGRKRKRIRNIITACTIAFALNLLTQFVLPALGTEILPPIGHLYAFVMIGGIHYANVRYRLFSIPSDLLFDEIMTEMMDLFFLLSPQGQIVKLNSRSIHLLGYRLEDLLNQPLAQYLQEPEKLDEVFAGQLKLGVPSYLEAHCLKRTGETVPMRLSCSCIFGGDGEVLGIVVIGQDMTMTKRLEQEIEAQQKTEAKLRESEERFRALFDKHSSVMCLIDPETLRIMDVNDAASGFYGYTSEQLTGMKITELNGIPDSDIGETVSEILSSNETVLLLQHRLASGERRDVEIHAATIPFGTKRIIFSIIHDITERRKAEEHITFLAYHDSLTGLFNRKYFYNTIEQELDRLPASNESIAVLYIDLDGFKHVNDTYGHESGDLVLREFGNRIKSFTRQTDLVSRIGGDEFAVLLFDISNIFEAQTIADKISSSLNLPFAHGGAELNVQASIGISIFPQDGVTADALIKVADHHMYAVKRDKKTATLHS